MRYIKKQVTAGMTVNRKKHPYTMWLFWCITNICNLRCIYCSGKPERYGKDGFPGNIQIKALMKTLSATKNIFRIGFTGGEPFLIPNIITACKEITQTHYISMVTNLTSLKVDDFVKQIPPEKVISILASTHIKELERNNLVDRYVSNFLMCKEMGFNISAVEIAYPPYISEVRKYKTYFRDRGITLQYDPFKGNYNGKQFPDSYTEDEIKAFDMNIRLDSYTTMFHKGDLCNAGYNVGIVSPDGDIRPCFASQVIIGNIYKGITFRKELVKCPFEFCKCPLKYYDPFLFQKAMTESGISQ